jgi:hypothetical protein
LALGRGARVFSVIGKFVSKTMGSDGIAEHSNSVGKLHSQIKKVSAAIWKTKN